MAISMSDDINKVFGLRVAELRRGLGISQEELADRCGIHRTYIGSVERGEKSPTLNTVGKIARGLRSTVPDFFKDMETGDSVVDVETFRDGVFALNTRRFGAVAELMVQRLFGLERSADLRYDLLDAVSHERVEVKFSTVMKANECKIDEHNVVRQCLEANVSKRALCCKDTNLFSFDCNIQQVKADCFDVLYYGLFYADKIVIYKMSSMQVRGCRGYSDKQHRNNVGEGQFHINNKTLDYHDTNFKVMELDYGRLMGLFEHL